jgi:hypothetical protein
MCQGGATRVSHAGQYRFIHRRNGSHWQQRCTRISAANLFSLHLFGKPNTIPSDCRLFPNVTPLRISVFSHLFFKTEQIVFCTSRVCKPNCRGLDVSPNIVITFLLDSCKNRIKDILCSFSRLRCVSQKDWTPMNACKTVMLVVCVLVASPSAFEELPDSLRTHRARILVPQS